MAKEQYKYISRTPVYSLDHGLWPSIMNVKLSILMNAGNARNLRSIDWLVPLLKFAPIVSVLQSSLNNSCSNTLPYSECTAETSGSWIVTPLSSVAKSFTWSMYEWVCGCSVKRNRYSQPEGLGLVTRSMVQGNIY